MPSGPGNVHSQLGPDIVDHPHELVPIIAKTTARIDLTGKGLAEKTNQTCLEKQTNPNQTSFGGKPSRTV